MMQEIERDPLFKMHDIHDISKEELRERTMEKVNSRNIECLQDNTTHLVFAMLVPQFDPSLAKRICGYIQEAHGSHQFD